MPCRGLFFSSFAHNNPSIPPIHLTASPSPSPSPYSRKNRNASREGLGFWFLRRKTCTKLNCRFGRESIRSKQKENSFIRQVRPGWDEIQACRVHKRSHHGFALSSLHLKLPVIVIILVLIPSTDGALSRAQRFRQSASETAAAQAAGRGAARVRSAIGRAQTHTAVACRRGVGFACNRPFGGRCGRGGFRSRSVNCDGWCRDGAGRGSWRWWRRRRGPGLLFNLLDVGRGRPALHVGVRVAA